MPGLTAEIDPASEGTGTTLVLVDNTSKFLLQWDWPEPDEDPLLVESRDTEGALVAHNRHRNRTGRIVLRAVGASHTALDATVTEIERKVQKVRAEGGTLKVTLPSGKTAVADLLAGSQVVAMDRRWITLTIAEVTLTFTALPYWRGAAIQLADRVETAAKALVWTETGVKGSVPGLVKLVIDDDQGQAQRLVIMGLQSRYYDAASSAAFLYECESRTALGGSATAAGPSGASGGGSNVMRNTGLIAMEQAIMSTQASGGGAHLSHVGAFRVWVRLQVPTSNTGTVSVRLEWGEGDFRRTTLNSAVEIPDSARGGWVLADLGVVRPSKVRQGTQRWEGRVNAWSTVVGDDIDLDCFIVAPIAESYCEIPAEYVYRAGTVAGRDEFTGIAAGTALNGRVAPAGGTWATSGAATDFTAADAPLATDETMSRATGADAFPGRRAILGTATYTDAEAGVAFYSTPDTGAPRHQAIVRHVDASNYLRAEVSASNRQILIWQRVAGLETLLGYAPTPNVRLGWFGLRVIAYSTGHVRALLLDGLGNMIAEAIGQSAAVATGGALASGTSGFGDYNPGGAMSRYYRNAYAAVPSAEPLTVAPTRSLEVRSDGAARQSSDGALWIPATIEGFYPVAPPAWNEGRTLRALVATCRGPKLAAGVWADAGIDDVSARLTYTPRHVSLPEA